MKLTATQQFTDKQGNAHKANETFEVQDQNEAQEYIRNGQAREQGAGTGTKEQQGTR